MTLGILEVTFCFPNASTWINNPIWGSIVLLCFQFWNIYAFDKSHQPIYVIHKLCPWQICCPNVLKFSTKLILLLLDNKVWKFKLLFQIYKNEEIAFALLNETTLGSIDCAWGVSRRKDLKVKISVIWKTRNLEPNNA